ncbi:hypothetical protein ILUMI_24284 [Ignelater luminosus]|uniref:Uncharacterized protein n=1 Tax=Ignelater luminosus TaxID=2038154 RepID=A0A8K0C7C6_IGNLU|nr:hypothetical protein ILUMI_24284 [Ignelater luminosus]
MRKYVKGNVDNNKNTSNSTIQNTTDKQQIQTDTNKTEVRTKQKGSSTINTNTADRKDGKSRLLILADSHGRDMARLCKNTSSDKFITQCILKPNALFQNVTENISNLTKDSNKRDYVILIAGVNNALKGIKISDETVIETFNQMQKTNLICGTVSYWHGRHILNQFSYEINPTLFNTVQQFSSNVELLDSNSILRKQDFTKHGLLLNSNGKNILCTNIIHGIQYNMEFLTVTGGVKKNNVFLMKGNLIIVSPDNEDSQQTSSTISAMHLHPTLPRSENELSLVNHLEIENKNSTFNAPGLYPTLPSSDSSLASLNAIKKGENWLTVRTVVGYRLASAFADAVAGSLPSELEGFACLRGVETNPNSIPCEKGAADLNLKAALPNPDGRPAHLFENNYPQFALAYNRCTYENHFLYSTPEPHLRTPEKLKNACKNSCT